MKTRSVIARLSLTIHLRRLFALGQTRRGQFFLQVSNYHLLLTCLSLQLSNPLLHTAKFVLQQFEVGVHVDQVNMHFEAQSLLLR